jgi:hypothetical protein
LWPEFIAGFNHVINHVINHGINHGIFSINVSIVFVLVEPQTYPGQADRGQYNKGIIAA